MLNRRNLMNIYVTIYGFILTQLCSIHYFMVPCNKSTIPNYAMFMLLLSQSYVESITDEVYVHIF